jgi:hypothetical protein
MGLQLWTNLDAEVNITGAWETTGKNIKISAKEILGYCELKLKTWFNEGYLELLDPRKQVKFQWL